MTVICETPPDEPGTDHEEDSHNATLSLLPFFKACPVLCHVKIDVGSINGEDDRCLRDAVRTAQMLLAGGFLMTKLTLSLRRLDVLDQDCWLGWLQLHYTRWLSADQHKRP